MFRRLAYSLLQPLVTLWAIASGTFILMEYAPGGPSSQERRLDPLTEASNLARIGLADLILAPCDGTWTPHKTVGVPLAPGEKIGHIYGPRPCDVFSPRGGHLLLVLTKEGETVRSGQILAALRPSALLRYVRTMASLLRLDLGVTYSSRGARTVAQNIADGLPVSALVGSVALFIAMLLGIPQGLISAAKRGSALDKVLALLATAQISVPAIVLGPLLLYLLAVRHPIFSPGGLAGPSDLLLPSFTLGFILAGLLARMVRASASDFLASPVATTLYARGLTPIRVLGVHALRHATIPMLGYLPPLVASLMTGSIVVERVFNLPGVARYLIDAALSRDHPMVMGVVLLYSAILVFLTTLASALHPLVDPRLKVAHSHLEPTYGPS